MLILNEKKTQEGGELGFLKTFSTQQIQAL